MTPVLDLRIVDQHAQLFIASCIPSSVELVLKLEGRVPVGYDDEQNQWGSTVGSLAIYDKQTIAGVTFTSEFAVPRGPSFPIDDMFDRMDEELGDGRFVIISLESAGGWHMWVVYAKHDGEYRALSKNGSQTIFTDKVRASVEAMEGTDILTYK